MVLLLLLSVSDIQRAGQTAGGKLNISGPIIVVGQFVVLYLPPWRVLSLIWQKCSLIFIAFATESLDGAQVY